MVRKKMKSNQAQGIINLKANHLQDTNNLKANRLQDGTNLKANRLKNATNLEASIDSQDRATFSRVGVALRDLKASPLKDTISNEREIIGSDITGRAIINERLTIQWIFPIKKLLEMEITHQLNDHGKIYIKTLLSEEVQIESLSNAYQEHEIQIFDTIDKGLPVAIFYGKVEKVTYEFKDKVLVACIHGISYSIDLEQEKKYRSFQDISLPFEQIAEEITDQMGARFLWHMDKKRPIRIPYFQYEESDWDFCKRLASRFNCPIVADITTGRSDIHFGMQSGIERNNDDGETLEVGFSNEFYTEGGYEKGKQRGSYGYIKFKHDRVWQMGDTLRFRNQVLMVYERNIQFIKGELVYISTLGGTGLLWQKPIYNELFQGLKIQGIIRKVEEESVYVQFFFDSEEKANYPWPWVPEVGNLSYIMPEVGSLVTLSFSSNDEKDGLATHLLRTNSDSSVYQREPNREFITIHDKMLGLHPGQMIIRGKDQLATITMDDNKGILLQSPHGIRISAKGDILVQTKSLSVVADQQILMQNRQSNIELCKNFNLFAPLGTAVTGGNVPKVLKKARPATEKSIDILRLSYVALGSIPEKKSLQSNSVLEGIIRKAKGAIPAVAGAPMLKTMHAAITGQKVDKEVSQRAFASIGNHTNNGGFRIPKGR